MRRLGKLNVLLLLVCGLLGVGVKAKLEHPQQQFIYNVNDTSGSVPLTVEQVRIETPSVQSYGSISERPLFAETRRPPAEKKPEPPKPEPVVQIQMPAIALTGIASSGSGRMAILSVASDPAQVVRVGEIVDGWRMVALKDRAAIFERSGVSYTAQLGETAPTPSGTHDTAGSANRSGAVASGSNRKRPRSRAEVAGMAAKVDMADLID